MIRISPHPLWIGHGGEGYDFIHILEYGIEAVVELAFEEEPWPTRRELIACRFPLIDGTGNKPELLVLAVRTVAALLASKVPTLICCGSGLSRAPAVAAAALAVANRQTARGEPEGDHATTTGATSRPASGASWSPSSPAPRGLGRRTGRADGGDGDGSRPGHSHGLVSRPDRDLSERTRSRDHRRGSISTT